MNKITQKEFKNLLQTNKTGLVLSEFTMYNIDETYLNKIEKFVEKNEKNVFYRDCIKIQTNALAFETERKSLSWLYFDNKAISKTYYKHENILFYVEEYNLNEYEILIYLIK